MTGAKRTAKKKQAGQSAAGPVASRPRMPAEYGIPKDKKGLLPWSHVSERMAQAMHYWVCTVSPEGQPHATPVDGLWINDRLYFGGSPKTKRNRNLVENPAACIHLENGLDVVILQGRAEELRDPDQALAQRLIDASKQKYGFAPKPEDFAKGGTFAFRPQVVMAWKSFPKDVTRWQFTEEEATSDE